FCTSVLQECILMRVTTESKNAESFYINYAYIDKNGKSTSCIYKKLGTFKELSEKLHTDCDSALADWDFTLRLYFLPGLIGLRNFYNYSIL
ncbi:MAG: hypothetical protein U0J83_06045, partial [Bulleidia sp.]|nr:hypothetical protein [Bulleidia sp.]